MIDDELLDDMLDEILDDFNDEDDYEGFDYDGDGTPLPLAA